MVVTLRYGAGVKGKVVEAIHRSIPSVLTPIAAEGIEAVNTGSVITEPEPSLFARTISDLYTKHSELEHISHACENLIKQNFSKERAISAIELGTR